MPSPARRASSISAPAGSTPIRVCPALLSACAGKPQISAQLESSQYLSRAGRNYTPPGPASDPWGPYVAEAAAKYDVPDRWIREVMRQESGGRLYGRGGELITSGAGAMGLMQVMPGTYDELRARYSELGNDPFDPHNNILAGTAYIREMYDIYGSPGFLAAYNAGPGRLDDYLTRNRTLPEETRRYVASIGPKIAGAFPATRSPGEQYAMNAVPLAIPDGPRYARSDRYSVGTAIALNPAPYVAPAAPARPLVQVAQLPEPPPAPFIALAPRPQLMQVAQLPEPPRSESPRYEPPRFELARAEPSLVAPIPQPRAQQFAAMLVPVSPRPSPFAAAGFSLVSRAHAEPIVAHRPGFAPSSVAGAWAVQVGAFANQGLASAATSAARDHARDVLGGARIVVASVRQPHGVLYRARLTGLSRDAATQACERLTRNRTSCMIVSPDAQS